MATQADVRRIALGFRGAVEEKGRFAFSVPVKGKLKGFAWVWLERIDPRKGRVPQPKVLAVRVASLDDKEFILAMDSKKYFTEPHYNGYPAVLVRLADIPVRELRPLLEQAWECTAPKALQQETPVRARPARSTRSRRTS